MLDDAPRPWPFARGLVKHAYHTAAEVTNGLVTFTDRTATSPATLVGAVIDSDPYLLTQAPLEFIVPTKSGVPWRWPILELSVTDGRVAAKLGGFMEGA